MTEAYKTVKVHKDKVSRAKKKGMTVNEYIDHLEALVDADRTTEQETTLERLKANEGAIASMAEALKHQRYMQDSQARKTEQLIEAVTKITNAYGADVEFVQALKKEITQ